MGLLRKFANYWVVAPGYWLLLSASSKFYHSSVCLDSTLTFQFVRGYHRSTVKTRPDIAMYPPKPYASIQPVQKCLQDNIIWKSMLGKGEFAALGRQRVGYWLLSKSGTPDTLVHCSLSTLSVFDAEILLLKNIIHFVCNVVCGLLFTVQPSVSSLKCSVQCVLYSVQWSPLISVARRKEERLQEIAAQSPERET